MNYLLAFLFALVTLASWPCRAQAGEVATAELIEKLNGATTDDTHKSEVQALKNSVITLLKARRYDAVLELFAKTRERTPGRSIIYEAIINSGVKRSLDDLPFCVDVFVFAVSQLQERSDELTRRQRPHAEIFIRQLAYQILFLLQRPSLIHDSRLSMLESDPQKWLTETLKEVASAGIPEIRESAGRALKRLENRGTGKQDSRRMTPPTSSVDTGGPRKAAFPERSTERKASRDNLYMVLGAIAVLLAGMWMWRRVRSRRRRKASGSIDSI